MCLVLGKLLVVGLFSLEVFVQSRIKNITAEKREHTADPNLAITFPRDPKLA